MERLKPGRALLLAAILGTSLAVPEILGSRSGKALDSFSSRKEGNQETSLPILDLLEIQRFYVEDSPVVTGYKGIWLEGQRGELRYLLGDLWKLEGDLDSGETLRYGGLFSNQELVQLVENLPVEFTPDALFFVDLEDSQDVFLQGRIGEEEIYLKATALIDEVDQPKVPTWAKIEEGEMVVWDPGANLWERS